MQGVSVKRIAPTQISGYWLRMSQPAVQAISGMSRKLMNRASAVGLSRLAALPDVAEFYGQHHGKNDQKDADLSDVQQHRHGLADEVLDGQPRGSGSY